VAGVHEKKGYHTNSNSYVRSTTSEALIFYSGLFWDGTAIACRALTMVKFPMKEGGDDLPQQVHFFDSRACKTFNWL